MDELFGRLHPLLVHLPIGFILLAFLVETLAFFRKSIVIRPRLIAAMYLAGFIAAVTAVSTGLLLASHDKFAPDPLNTHKWLGIAVMALTLGVSLMKWYDGLVKPRLSYIMSGVLVTVLAVAGHFGGVLTHGEDYLFERAPAWVQKIAGSIPGMHTHGLTDMHPDSVVIYKHILRPLFDAQCVQCHHPGYTAGEFDATTYAALLREGESGYPVVPGNVLNSELLRRVTLPPTHQKFMPPRGKQLGFTDIHILQHWIEQGADSLARFEPKALSPELLQLLIRDYRLDYTPKPHYATVVVDSLDQSTLESLASVGFSAAFLGEENFLLDVQFEKDTLDTVAADMLLSIKDHITFLDLSNVHIQRATLDDISGFTHLTRLDLHESNVIDSLVFKLAQLQHLEVLNVYGTGVTEAGLRQALRSPALKRVYVWQTSIPDDQRDLLRKEFPHIELVDRFAFEIVDTTQQVLNFPE